MPAGCAIPRRGLRARRVTADVVPRRPRLRELKLNNLVSNPKLTYIQLSNNPHTGGTCFGDSGGPTFDNTDSTMLVAVTSFGYSPNCTGVGGASRLDQPDDLEFLAGFGITPAS